MLYTEPPSREKKTEPTKELGERPSEECRAFLRAKGRKKKNQSGWWLSWEQRNRGADRGKGDKWKGVGGSQTGNRPGADVREQKAWQALLPLGENKKGVTEKKTVGGGKNGQDKQKWDQEPQKKKKKREEHDPRKPTLSSTFKEKTENNEEWEGGIIIEGGPYKSRIPVYNFGPKCQIRKKQQR